jgi:SPP1 gp7 family putative phage head morphogenesis protein
MILQLDPEGQDDELERKIREEIERRFGRELTQALRNQLMALLPPDATDDDVRAMINRLEATSEPVRDILRRHLQQSADLGVSVALDTLSNVGLSFDWTMAHTEAAEWASRYSYELIRGMNATTRQRLQVAVSDWFTNGDTLDQLRDELGPLFGKRRAAIIAQTETTRAAAEGTILGYEASGVTIEIEWTAVADERVCPVCGRLHGKRAALRGEFEPGIRTPPAHVGCRCFVRPVIAEV